MEVLKYILQLFKGKNTLAKQISLFSIIGITVILFNNFSSTWTNLFFENFYIAPPSSPLLLNLNFGLALLLMIYLTGYRYKIAKNVISDNPSTLPEFDLEPLSVIIKIFPIALVWGIYYFIASTLFTTLLQENQNLLSYCIFYTVIFCLIPFIMIILCEFTSDFKYRKKYFNPLYLYKVLDKTLGDVIILSLETLIPAILLFGFIYSFFLHISNIRSEVLLFGVRYFGIILNTYLLINLKYVYFIGLAKIAKSKIIQ